MKFKTNSGTIYELTDIVAPYIDPESTKFQLAMFTGKITRISDKPLINLGIHELPEMQAKQGVMFERPPVVGQRFGYIHETNDGCYSTPVVEIDVDEEEYEILSKAFG